jgi:hypothetical protein
VSLTVTVQGHLVVAAVVSTSGATVTVTSGNDQQPLTAYDWKVVQGACGHLRAGGTTQSCTAPATDPALTWSYRNPPASGVLNFLVAGGNTCTWKVRGGVSCG